MSVLVTVPATSANLGAGFDCVGVAVERRLRLAAQISPEPGAPVELRYDGTLSGITVPVEHDLTYRGFAAVCERAGRVVPHGLVLHATSEIPVARGLGSSAAAVVAGAVAANVLLDLALDDHALVEVCTALEGHPDNVAPAIHGGAILAIHTAAGTCRIARLDVHESLRFAFAVPDFEVDTRRARAVLPDAVAHSDARAAAAASAALVQGLARADRTLLAIGLEGPLHVPYRRPLVRGFDSVVGAACVAGAFGATLSGSGSSIVAVTTAAAVHDVAAAMAAAWSQAGVNAATFVSAPRGRGYEISRTFENDPTGVPVSPDAPHSPRTQVLT
jgi:homoserine kinase